MKKNEEYKNEIKTIFSDGEKFWGPNELNVGKIMTVIETKT